MDNHIKTVIIDTGIDNSEYQTGELWLNVEVDSSGQIRESVSYRTACGSNHGSVCCAILRKYCLDADIGSIKILDKDGCGNRDQLVAALHYCADHKIKLVNLSLGTIDFRDFKVIERAVNHAVRNGTIIVAASSNRNIYTCPASLPNVIGVKGDTGGKLGEGQYIFYSNPLDGVDIKACSSHLLLRNDGSSEKTSLNNSFAAPMLTAIVHNMLIENPILTMKDIKEKLSERAVNLIAGNSTTGMYDEKNELIDIPVVALYDYDENRWFDLLIKLKESFCENGYNAIAVSTEYECAELIITRIYYNGSMSFHENDRIILKDICKAYDPDLILAHVNAIDLDYCDIKRLEARYDIDIKIIVQSGKDVIHRILNSTLKSNTVLLTTDTLTTKITDKIVNMSEKDMIDEVRNSIIDLYKSG